MKLKASVFPLKNQIVSIIMFHLKSHKMMVWHEFSIWKGNYIGSPHFWNKPNQWMQESRLPRQRKLREAVPDNPCTVYLPTVTPRITANICKICCILPDPLMVICLPMSSQDNNCWPSAGASWRVSASKLQFAWMFFVAPGLMFTKRI